MVKKIYINPGHTDTDPGAVKYAVERELNVKVSEFMRAYLAENYECEIRVYSALVRNVANDANAWGADLFVSNHFNAAGGDGYEALVYSAKRKDLGAIFEKHVKAVGQNSRGVKYRPGLVVLNSTNMPAVLNEGAFVDNKKDIQDWDEDHELKKLGIAYAKAAAEYMKLPAKKTASKPTAAPVTKPATKPNTLKNFIKDVQKAIGATVDGIAGSETLSKTPTVSAKYNRKHAVVKVIQKRLYELGYKEVGTADGVAGAMFTAAVTKFQKDNGCVSDGIITARNKTWKKLLGMK